MTQRAMSFTAFCTVGQRRRESVTHHINAAKTWCDRYGYDLELYAEPPEDTPELPQGSPCLGGLYLVQYRVRKGLIKPGTALILESLDGVPRRELPTAVSVLTDLMESGLTVVTLYDGKVWDSHVLSGAGDFMQSLISLYSVSSDAGPGLDGESI